jgi:hypothetical protein
VDGEIIDDNRAAELITVITTTNPIPSIPTLKHLYPAQKSLFQIPALAKCKKIIVFDGIPPSYANKKDLYDQYKKKVIELTKSDSFFKNTELVFCDKWVHLAGTLKEAIKLVTTPYIFVYQHDDILRKWFDLPGCIASMKKNPNIKYIHLTRYPNNGPEWYWPVNSVAKGESLIPLTRCFGWSDYAHVATVDYYKNFVLPQCDHGAMEWYMHWGIKKAIEGKSQQEMDRIHLDYGAYLYGEPHDGNYIHHSDGARN